MPHEPKRRHSRERKGERRSRISLPVTKGIVCNNCGTINPMHTVCKSCGFYKGKLVKMQKTKKPTDK